MEKNKKHVSSHPKYTANIFSKLFLCWLTPLVWYARKHRIGTKDLHDVLPENQSRDLSDKLEKFWGEEVNSGRKKKRQPKLWKSLWRLFGCSILKYGIHSFICDVACKLWHPIAVSKIISYFNPKTTMTPSEVYGYAVSIIVVICLDGILKDYATFGLKNIGVRMRIACSSLIYRKLLRLPHSSTKQLPTGQVINLLSNDVVRLEYFLPQLHCIWTIPIFTLAVCYISLNNIGGPGLIGIGILVLQAIPLHVVTTYLHLYLRQKIAIRTDKRLLLLNESIRGIRILKMFTWENPFKHLVKLARRKEMNLIAVQMYIKKVPSITVEFIHQVSILVTSIILKIQGARINPSQIYPLLMYLSIMRGHFVYFLAHAFQYTAECIAALERIQEFLLLQELVPDIMQSKVGEEEVVVFIRNANAHIMNKENVDVLHHINLEIKSKKLYVVFGPVGSGKSSLLKLIIGELETSSDSVFIKGDISFASQEPWLFNESIKNNILFGNPYDDEKYNKVITACALLKDFAQLPYGDKTIVGEHGCVMSGGQRVRINLARALYRDADIYLLDDPLCAADVVVGRHLFDNCVNGLLRDKTRILVTHHLQYLKEADDIILMNNGHIVYQGNFDDFKKNDKFLKYVVPTDATDDLVVGSSTHFDQCLSSNISNELNEEAEEEFEESSELMPKKSISNIKDQNNTEVIHTESIATNNSQIYTESIATNNSQKSIYKSYIKYGGLCMLASLTIVVITTSALSNLFDYIFSQWVNYQNKAYNTNINVTLPSNVDTELSFFYSLNVLGGLLITKIILSMIRIVLFTKFSINATKVIHNRMLSCLFNAPVKFFDNNNSGRILNRFSKDMGMVDNYISTLTSEPYDLIIFAPLLLLQIMSNNKWLVVLCVVITSIFFTVVHIFLNILRESRRLEGHAKSMVYSHASASLCGVVTIRSCKGESVACNEFDVRQDRHTAAYSTYLDSLFAFSLWINILQALFGSAVPFIFILLKDTGLAGATVGMVMSQVLNLNMRLLRGAKAFTDLDANMISVERVLHYTKIKPEVKFKESADVKLPSPWPVEGEIKFDHVYLKYSNSPIPILKNLDFTIKSQSKVGVVGRTGAGKSSLIAALFGLSETNGSIYIDGIDTSKIDLQQLRKKISILPQEPILFSVSVRTNLDPLHEFDDSLIWTVLHDLELNKEFRSLDEMLDQNNLSHGKQQLLCLARAILNKNRILVLDEITANVDAHAEALIQKAIEDNFKHCTILTIAHRLHTVMDSDKLLVIDNGEVVEYDHPHLLLQDKNSHLSKMVQQADSCIANGLRRIAKEAFESKRIQLALDD